MTVRLRLYVAGGAPNSIAARENLARVVGGRRAVVDVIDVFDAPERALADGAFVTPMLVRVDVDPPLKLVGSLSDRAALERMLGRTNAQGANAGGKR